MASEDFLIRLSVVFKKFGLILNEFLPIVDCLILSAKTVKFLLLIQAPISGLGFKVSDAFAIASCLLP